MEEEHAVRTWKGGSSSSRCGLRTRARLLPHPVVKIYDLFFDISKNGMKYSIDVRGFFKKKDSRLLMKVNSLIYHFEIRLAE